MYKLLIVDDEYWVRTRLSTTIDWNALGIGEIFQAENGEQALRLSIKEEPDILITDINMPILSGTDLMLALNQSALFPKVVLISGYNEFEYARSAVKLGAVDYLLKPIDESELVNIVKTCISDLQKDKIQKQFLDVMNYSTNEIQKKLLSALLEGVFVDSAESVSFLEQLGMSIPYSTGICLIAQADELPLDECEGRYIEDTLINFSICNILDETLQKYFPWRSVVTADDMNVAIVFSNFHGQELRNHLDQVCTEVRNQFKKSFSRNTAYGIGTEVTSLLDLHQSFNHAKSAFNRANYFGWNKIYQYGKLDIPGNLNLQNIYLNFNVSPLIYHIKTCNEKKALTTLDTLISDFSSQVLNLQPLQVKLFYICLINSLFEFVSTIRTSSEDYYNLCIEAIEEINSITTLSQMKQRLKDLVIFFIKQYGNYVDSKKNSIVDKAVDYIEKNYMKPLTMKNVADTFYVNSCYFCKIFKEQTGQTFTHYLMKLRIEKAKELMKDESLKLYDISGSVGYENVQYFSTIFKEIEGITPSQFRNLT